MRLALEMIQTILAYALNDRIIRLFAGWSPSGPTGRENEAQGRGRRPTPWVER